MEINTNSGYGLNTNSYVRTYGNGKQVSDQRKFLTPPSEIKMGELGFGADNLGRQYTLNYDESSTEDDPVVLVKGIDEKGNQFEQKVRLNDVDMGNATYLEMAAVAAHLKTDSCTPLALSSGHPSYFEKADYKADFDRRITDLNKQGAYEAAAYEMEKLKKYLMFFHSIRNKK